MAAVAAATAMLAAAAITEQKGGIGGIGGGGGGVRGGGGNNDNDDNGASTSSSSPAAAVQQQEQHRTRASQQQQQQLQQHPDLLDTTVVYLKQREGIDKTLKIIRYAARLVAAAAPLSSRFPEAAKRADNLQQALGSARKAYRLGKFLQHVSAWRSLPALDYSRCLSDPVYRTRNRHLLLERLATAGEGMYYFCDQAAFYFKAGALGEPRKGPWERRFSRLSAWSETVGYACSIALGLAKVRQLGAAEAALRGELVARYRASGGGPSALDPQAVARLRQLRHARALRTAAIAQDAADALLALSDLLEGRGGAVGRAVSHPALLALCGLLSAAVSTHKNWEAAVKTAAAASAK